MLKIYGRKNSSSVQLVMWTIAELGIENQRLDFGHGHAPTSTKEFLEKNPMGRVPVIEDGEICLFESAAILRYLGAKYGDNAFWPENHARRGELDIWAEWGKNTFTEAVLEIFVFDVRLAPESRESEILKNAVEKLVPLAGMLNERIADGPWIGGEDFSFADIACGHILYRYYKLNWERPQLPALDAYYKRLLDRPAFRDHVMISYEELRGSY